MAAVALLLFGAGAVPQEAAAQTREFENLKVLPSDITNDELTDIMLDNLRGLGLPRLAGSGCLFCHVGDLEQPRSTWDYASDAKPMKQKARVMLAMVREINATHLADLENRIDPSMRVTCYSCHAGRTDPRPLPDVLLAADAAGGVDSLVARYQALRTRYYAGDAYDFRVGVLESVALGLADRRRIDDAIRVGRLEAEANAPDPEATAVWVRLRLERTIGSRGVPAALAELDSLAGTLPAAVMQPSLLDALAWRLNRTDREAQGHALIAANLERFPNEYTPNESMAFILSSTGRREAAMAILERWLATHPDHARARRLLTNMRGR